MSGMPASIVARVAPCRAATLTRCAPVICELVATLVRAIVGSASDDSSARKVWPCVPRIVSSIERAWATVIA